MRKHPIRKFLGLTVLYAVIIVGIFILQFKTESVISRNIGSLTVSLAQTEKDNNTTKLKNQLQVRFNGISFSANETNPAVVSLSSDETSKHNLVLDSWSQPTPLSAQFSFTDGSSITFAVSDETSAAQLSIIAKPAAGFDTFTLFYEPASGYSVTESFANRILITSKDNNYALKAPHITSNQIVFTSDELAASYIGFDPTKRFAFESIIGLPLADSKTYDTTVRQIRSSLLDQFEQTISSGNSSSLTEQEVIAYVAEMANNGRYDEALDKVPESFKKGNKRTYLSSPYFDNLTSMNRSLAMQTEKYNSMVSSSIDSQNLDIFTVDGIADYILREKRTTRMRTLLSLPATMEKFEPTVLQASGIIQVYVKLAQNDMALAGLFDSILDRCVETVASGCTVTDDTISISDNGTAFTTEQMVRTGAAFVLLGTIKNRIEYTSAGYLMVNSALHSVNTPNLQLLGALYPAVAANNTFYPHTIVLGYYGTRPVWAWTCANNITYTKATAGVMDINITFTLNKTQYLIFSGIPTFHANIEIQKQKFRSDPRFETYNSSGYIYNEDTQTLLLKSRHKSQVELIRLFCDPQTNYMTAGESSKGSYTLVAPAPKPAEDTAAATTSKPAATPSSTATAPKATTAARTDTEKETTSTATTATSVAPATTAPTDTGSTATSASTTTTTGRRAAPAAGTTPHGPNSEPTTTTTTTSSDSTETTDDETSE